MVPNYVGKMMGFSDKLNDAEIKSVILNLSGQSELSIK